MPPTVHVSPLPKGTVLSRFLQSLIVSRGNLREAVEYAKQWADSPAVGFVLKSAIGAGSTAGVDWSALYPYGVSDEFIQFERTSSIVGEIAPLMRATALHTKVPRQLAHTAGYWVEELHPKGISAGLRFDTVVLERKKVVAPIIVSEELGQANPANEATIRECVTTGTAKVIDNTFLDPSQAASTSSPGSITNGATAITSTGVTSTAIASDISKMIGALTTWNKPRVRFLMHPQTAAKLLGTNPQSFAGLSTASDSLLFGIPLVTGGWAPAGLVVLADLSTILFNDSGVSISVSTQGSVQMDSVPTDAPTSSTTLVSLWQENLIGILAERVISWLRTSNTGVVYMSISLP
jgi:HK97 family phage major capsid protein